MKRIQPELVPLLLAAFLAPIIGGQISLDAMPLTEGFVSGFMGGPELPFFTRAILGSLVALSLAISLVRRRVVQIPSLSIAGQTLILVGLVGLSVFSSEFGYLSYSTWLNWVVYGLCLFATVAVVGRRTGIRAMTWAMVVGGTITALKGIWEYADVRAIEPGHRIFADWVNPNALAGILGILIPLALGLFLTSDRIEALGSALCAGLMLFALALTQSKGGLLTTGMSIVVVAIAGLAWKGKAKVARVLIPVALAGLLVFSTMATARAQGGLLSRVTSAGASQEQSGDFRVLLWKSTVEMIRAKPSGYGVGTYRFESARPGLTEQTYHAHQTWLQLAVEASPLAALSLLAIAVSWTWALLYGAKKWPWQEAGLRAGILGACVAAAADGFLESNLIYTGIGIALFIVIGLGLQASTDGSLPEYTPKSLRWLLVGLTCALPMILLWHTAAVEVDKAVARTAMETGDRTGAESALAGAHSLAPADGETLYLQSRLQSGTDMVDTLKRAIGVTPVVKYQRAFAAAAYKEGRKAQAMTAIEKALERDPNNLATLELKYQLQASDGDLTSAVETAKRLVGVEDSVYFRTRAIPELVALETYDAGVFLAEHTSAKEEKIKLLQGAVNGYAAFFQRTAPTVRQVSKIDPRGYFGHNMDELREVAARAKAAALELQKLYLESGETESAGKVSSTAELFTAD